MASSKVPLPPLTTGTAKVRACLGWCSRSFKSKDAGDRLCRSCRRRLSGIKVSRRDVPLRSNAEPPPE